jgi:predicted phosphodiesterase
MRIAVLADIHGNLPALEEALAEVERSQVDRVIVAGDMVVGSPDSFACWRRVLALGCPIIRGNHERYIFDLDTARAPASWKTPRFGPVHYAAAQFSTEQRRELAALPAYLEFGDCPDLLLTHGSLRSDNDLIFPYTSDAEIAPMFAGHAAPWIARGHNHFASVRLWGDRRIVTVGSVGLPLDGTPAAQFTILERRGKVWDVFHRAIPYDVSATLRRFDETGYLESAGPMASLYRREVETASFTIIPFLAYYRKVSATNPAVKLEDAVSAFRALG